VTDTIAEFLAHCRSKVGIHESPPGSNDNPFGVEFGWDGVAWCCEYAWCMYHDCSVDLPIKSAGVYETWAWARENGFLIPSTSPERTPGDAVMRTWTGKQPGQDGWDASLTHMQILLGSSGSALDLIGGNQADSFGGVVSYDTATAGDATILGVLSWARLFSSPLPGPSAHTPTPPPEKSPSHPNPKPMLYDGCPETSQTEPWIRAVQEKVGLKDAEVDGQFGPQTKEYVEAYQRAHGLSDDGVVGPMTYVKMDL
jgi:peptidoglycan hydrolase-like protein with peptidoglycan-binding domain